MSDQLFGGFSMHRSSLKWLAALVGFSLLAPSIAKDAPEAVIQRVNAQFEEAHRTGEVAVMERVLAEDFALFHSGALAAQVESKQGFIRRLSTMPTGLFRSRDLEGVVVRVFGDMATAHGYLRTRSSSSWTGGRLKENRYHFLRVFRRERGAWRMVVWHSGWAVDERKEADFISDYLAVFPKDAPAAAGVAAVDGLATYREACAVCHDNGAMGAPSIGDRAHWQAAAAERARLYERAIAGYAGPKGVMPAKGGRQDLSDAAVKAAVDHLIGGAR
jgi:cytochrome c5/ketosteroid isomerase-like protein